MATTGGGRLRKERSSRPLLLSIIPPARHKERTGVKKSEKSTLRIGLESFPILSYPLLYAWFIPATVPQDDQTPLAGALGMKNDAAESSHEHPRFSGRTPFRTHPHHGWFDGCSDLLPPADRGGLPRQSFPSPPRPVEELH